MKKRPDDPRILFLHESFVRDACDVNISSSVIYHLNYDHLVMNGLYKDIKPSNLLVFDARSNELLATNELTARIRNHLAHQSGHALLEVPGKNPPAGAEVILGVLTKREHLDALIGDLNEKFQKDCQSYGCSRARRLYCVRVLKSVWPLMRQAAKRLIKWTAIVSAFKGIFG